MPRAAPILDQLMLLSLAAPTRRFSCSSSWRLTREISGTQNEQWRGSSSPLVGGL